MLQPKQLIIANIILFNLPHLYHLIFILPNIILI
nr:MAG TPA: hypothetical protein [Caudoviricetes sp.]